MLKKYEWYASDHHLNHANIIEFGRPFSSIEEHNETVIKNHNDLVGKNDNVLMMGDWSFNTGIELLSRLNGNLYGLYGNHDHKPLDQLMAHFKDIRAYHEDRDLNAIFSHIPLHESQLGRWGVNFHGHVHFNTLENPRYINLSLEATEYKPVSHDKITEIAKSLQEKQNDRR